MYLTVFTSIPVTWFSLLINSMYPFQSQNQIQAIKDKQFIINCLEQANCLKNASIEESWWNELFEFTHSYVSFSLGFHQLWWFHDSYNIWNPWNTRKIVGLHLGNTFTYIYIHYIQFWTVSIFGTCWHITCSIIIPTLFQPPRPQMLNSLIHKIFEKYQKIFEIIQHMVFYMGKRRTHRLILLSQALIY